MRIVITGANGLVGAALQRFFSEGHDVIPLTRELLDITREDQVREVIARLRPSLVINCTAIGVDVCQTNPSLARAVNVDGPLSLAAASADARADFVHFSTNYVFEGTLTPPNSYTIEDDARPVNIYGATKLEGERAVAARHPGSYIVRTSWVFGRGKDSFFSTLPQRLRSGTSTQVIRDMWASTTYVEDLGPRLAEILEHGAHGTYHLVNDGICSYEDFALEVARRLQRREPQTALLLDLVDVDELQRAAPRPRYTPMSCLLSSRIGLAPMRDWRDALGEFMNDEAATPTP